MKVDNKVINIKRENGNRDCEWKTLYKGEEVPKEWEGLFLKQGGMIIKEVKEIDALPKEEKVEEEKVEEEKVEEEKVEEEKVEEEKVEEEKVEEEKVEEIAEELHKEVQKPYTEKELFDMYRAEQVTLLEKLGAKTIPRYEKDRVKLILELQ